MESVITRCCSRSSPRNVNRPSRTLEMRPVYGVKLLADPCKSPGHQNRQTSRVAAPTQAPALTLPWPCRVTPALRDSALWLTPLHAPGVRQPPQEYAPLPQALLWVLAPTFPMNSMCHIKMTCKHGFPLLVSLRSGVAGYSAWNIAQHLPRHLM